MKKSKGSRDYFGKPWHCYDFFWTMRSHCTLLTFYHFLIKLWTCLCTRGQWEHDWVFQSVQTGEQSRYIYIFFFFSAVGWSSHVLFSRGGERKKKKLCMFSIIWMKDICIVEYCTENCGVIWLYLFLKFGTHFEFWFVLNTVFLALLFDHVNVKTSK